MQQSVKFQYKFNRIFVLQTVRFHISLSDVSELVFHNSSYRIRVLSSITTQELET
jgi:hypothetical protein